jgi:alpha(1,3/1,4) fucosyltransferase
MKQRINVNFAYFTTGFTPETFRSYFPFVYQKYDLILSPEPEVIFYSAFSPHYHPYYDPRHPSIVAKAKPGPYVRVFLTGENFEPAMTDCEFAIGFSALATDPNFRRLPLWVYENRSWGYGPERLIKSPATDWERIASEKSRFCNFVYRHDLPYRNAIFSQLNEYERVDAAGRCMNNMNGWMVPREPNRLQGKLEFLRNYKFTLAVENNIWPGYSTEKLVDPMYVASIPIYIGDPQAKAHFNTASYIDFSAFGSLKELLAFVREVNSDRDLYIKMLAAPFYHANTIPEFARDSVTLTFFDRIFAAALARRQTAT